MNESTGIITIPQVPGDWAVPGVYTQVSDVAPPDQLSGMPLRCVIIGQIGAGTGVANTVYQNLTAGQASALFGVGSALSLAVAAFIAEEPALTIDAVGVTPATGSASGVATLKFSGTATAAGTGVISLGGYRVSWPLSAGATAAQAAQALVTACNAMAANAQVSYLRAATGLSATLGPDGVTVSVSSFEAGTFTNDFDVRVSSAVADQVAGIAIAVTPMTGGTGTPSIAPALLALGETWYTDCALLLNDATNISAVVQEAARRATALVAQDMRVWVGLNGSQGAALALSAQFSTSQDLLIFAAENARWSPWIAATIACAEAAQSLNADPARQLRGITLSGLSGLAPDANDRFSPSQRNVLLNAGCVTFNVARDGTVTFERAVTACQISPEDGEALTRPWDVMIPAIGARVRYETDAYWKAQYPNFKLADDGSPLAAVDGVVTCKTLVGSWAALCLIYRDYGWIDDVETTIPLAVIQRDPSNRNRVNGRLPIVPIGALITIASNLQLQV